jgi:hypothetical protein
MIRADDLSQQSVPMGETDPQAIAVPLKEFLTVTRCPSGWRRHDLYLIRDDEVVFYVGRSDNAFGRVWEHLHGGFKGRSTVGRFILLNWPRSMRFTIELQSSASPRFASVGNDPDAAEQCLIERLCPCFNEVLNDQPTPLPNGYAPPDARVRHPKSLKRMMREASHAVQLERDRKSWG